MLEKEYKYFRENQEKLVNLYEGKIIVIKGVDVIGVYDSDKEAIEETTKEYELGTFLIQRCEPGQEVYTMTFHSGIKFN